MGGCDEDEYQDLGNWENWSWTQDEGWVCVGNGLGHYGGPDCCCLLGWGLLAGALWLLMGAVGSSWAP
eukprot:6708089-Heterocapsa_arctica.AAC.1